jgi:hypothetical protein
MAGRTYAENRPYLLPETLGELAGPVAGVIRLPLRLDWSERTEFHLDDADLNEEVLRQVWMRLYLPVRVRQSWEARFPDLRRAA